MRFVRGDVREGASEVVTNAVSIIRPNLRSGNIKDFDMFVLSSGGPAAMICNLGPALAERTSVGGFLK